MKKAVYVVFVVLVGVVSTAWAAQPDRITSAIDSRQTVVLKGTVSPRAQAKFDQGPLDPSMKLPYVTMVLKPSAAQQAAMDQLLADQQDPTSKNYRQWLTPEQFGARFGMSSNDIAKISAWLRSQGFAIVEVAHGRNWIAFSGTVAQIQAAFHTQIDRFQADGEERFANATEPSIPQALDGIVSGFRGLDNFKMNPMMVRRSPRIDPDYTISGTNFLAPADIANIFDINPLYTAGITGTGMQIAIMGQTDIQITDIENFRTGFGLPTNNPTQILATGCSDPGITGDQGEADLDLEWSGAVAQNASIIFVKCDTVTNSGVVTSLQYTINNKTAPVISMSYGACEAQIGSSYLTSTYQPMIQQANTQGQTLMVSSGDSGAAACDASTSSSATGGLAVNGLASPGGTGYGVVAVGGTEFNGDVNNESTYWNTSNGTTYGSAKAMYIPELAWDDSSAGTGLSTGYLASTGGGASIVFSKPSWQTGTGVPNDSARDVPDVAMPASPDHDGYIFCTAGSCASGIPTAVQDNSIVGGTSVACPVFAGIVALLNQYDKNTPPAGLGNIDSNLYSFAASHSTAFHDVPAGNYAIDPTNASGNVVPCTSGSPNCNSKTLTLGFLTTTGYDQATGLGSVDAYNFVTTWGGALRPTTTTVSVSPAAVNYQSSTPVTVTATVKPTSGSGTPTGTVTFYNGTTNIGTGTLNSSGTATLSYNVSALAYTTNSGVYSLTASYGGDTTFASSTSSSAATLDVQYFTLAASPTTVTVTAPGQSGTATITPTLYGALTASALSFTCTGLPSESTCTFGAPGSTGAVTLTISTTAASDLLRPQFGRHKQLFYALLLPGFLGVVSLGGRKRTLRGLQLLGLIVILSLPALWLACGGGSSGSGGQSNPGTPTGNSTITVTATTTTSTPGTTATFTLTVQ